MSKSNLMNLLVCGATATLNKYTLDGKEGQHVLSENPLMITEDGSEKGFRYQVGQPKTSADLTERNFDLSSAASVQASDDTLTVKRKVQVSGKEVDEILTFKVEKPATPPAAASVATEQGLALDERKALPVQPATDEDGKRK